MSKHNVLGRMADAAQLYGVSIPGVPLVEIAGDGRVLIENHMGVTEYGKQRISLKVKFGQICVCGDGLELLKITRVMAVISGKIQNVEIHKGVSNGTESKTCQR